MALQTPAATEALASELVLEGALPNSDKGIAAIVDLAKRSMTPIVVNVPVPNLGPACPREVPVVIDMRTGTLGSAAGADRGLSVCPRPQARQGQGPDARQLHRPHQPPQDGQQRRPSRRRTGVRPASRR